jgi:hypothetical protein
MTSVHLLAAIAAFDECPRCEAPISLDSMQHVSDKDGAIRAICPGCELILGLTVIEVSAEGPAL